MFGEAVALDLVQSTDRLLERNLGVGPVDQEKIDRADAETRNAFLCGALKIGGSQVFRLHFGRYEDLIAQAGSANALAHIALVVVHLCGVDVAIADGDRLLDEPRAILAAQRPGAEPDQWNAGAARGNNLSQGVSHTGA